jgi:AcrR family transcriptional regulator
MDTNGGTVSIPRPFGAPGGGSKRERLLEAMLAASGELGYEQVAVRHVLERAETSRATFYKLFKDREDCFAQAYQEVGEWLSRRVLDAAERQPSWRQGLRAGLAELLEFCAKRPAIAKALVLEVDAAGERSLSQRRELMERFARAVDVVRREAPDAHAPPPSTADFVVGAIDNLLAARLADGEADRIPQMLASLLHFVVMPYLGEAAAWEEMTAAPLATWKARREAAIEMP